MTTVALSDESQAFRKLQPDEFFRRFLRERVRPDGRAFDEARQIVVRSGTASRAGGSAVARLGGTVVACGVKAEVGVPQWVAPNQGRLSVFVQLGPLCSAKYSIGRPSPVALRMSQALTTALVGDHMEHGGTGKGHGAPLDLSQLCIREGKAVWVLKADLVCLEDAGNVFDAALLALVAALEDLRLPHTRVEEEAGAAGAAGEVFVVPSTEGVRLRLRARPVSLSFALMPSPWSDEDSASADARARDDLPLADPSSDEEKLCRGLVSAVVTNTGALLGFHKWDSGAAPFAIVKQCVLAAVAHARAAAVPALQKSARDPALVRRDDAY